MEILSNFFRRIAVLNRGTTSLRNDWSWIIIVGAISYFVALFVRLSDYVKWDNVQLFAGTERILSTHDAYFWLAQAKWDNIPSVSPLASLTRIFHETTGVGYTDIAFWAPAVVGSLVAIVCYLWGWLLAGRSGGIFGGLVGALTPGFYVRTRLGYFDTDMFTLFMPLLFTWFLAYWGSKHMRSSWQREGGEISETSYTPWMALVFGCLSRFTGIWHADILSLNILIFFAAFVLLLVLCHRGKLQVAIFELIVFMLAAFPGSSEVGLAFWPLAHLLWALGVSADGYYIVMPLICIGLATLLAYGLTLQEKRKIRFIDNKWIALGCFVLMAYFIGLMEFRIGPVLAKLGSYLKISVQSVVDPTGAIQKPVYPTITQSIIEAKIVPWAEVLTRMGYATWIGVLGLLATIWVVLIRPISLLLVPLVILSLASIKLGVRFTMFGGAPLCVLLGVGFVLCIRFLLSYDNPRRIYYETIPQALTGVAIIIFVYSQVAAYPITPVVTKNHAEALMELRGYSKREGMIWTWWDWGYASQYYSGMETTIDGGKHSGRDVFASAVVLTTPSILQANQMIRFSSQFQPRRKKELGYDPASYWDKGSAAEAMQQIESLGKDQELFSAKAPQYVVVTWKDLTISKWITYYGNWDLERGTTREAVVGNYSPGELGFNIQQGAIMNRQGGGGLVSDITILDSEHVETTEYYMNKLSPRLLPKRRHLIINKVSRQSVLMDRIAYRSMMTRLLTGEPNDPEITPYFKLVVDKLPFARIYEVVQ